MQVFKKTVIIITLGVFIYLIYGLIKFETYTYITGYKQYNPSQPFSNCKEILNDSILKLRDIEFDYAYSDKYENYALFFKYKTKYQLFIWKMSGYCDLSLNQINIVKGNCKFEEGETYTNFGSQKMPYLLLKSKSDISTTKHINLSIDENAKIYCQQQNSNFLSYNLKFTKLSFCNQEGYTDVAISAPFNTETNDLVLLKKNKNIYLILLYQIEKDTTKLEQSTLIKLLKTEEIK